MQKLLNADRAVLMAAFARIDVVALAVALGAVGAAAIALMTVTLLLKGLPPGALHVGPHLGLLAYYLPGYSVSWGGSVVGAFYGSLIGIAIGFVWAVLWNLAHYLYIALVLIRAYWWSLMAE